MEFIPLQVKKLAYFRASRLVSEPGKNTELKWYSISYLIDVLLYRTFIDLIPLKDFTSLIFKTIPSITVDRSAVNM